MNAASRAPAEKSFLRTVLASQRPLYLQAIWLSFISGSLMLTPSWFMFEVYGRVLNSRNERTLWMLLIATIGIYIAMEALDLVRSRVLHRAAENVDQKLRNPLFERTFEANIRQPSAGHLQLFTDLKTLRDFIPSAPVVAAMDLPAAVLFLGLLFAIGPWLGVMALVGALLQVAVAYSTEKQTMPQLTEATKASMQAHAFAHSTMRNAQVIESMGMLGDVHQRWNERQRKFLALQSGASEVGGVNSTLAKMIQQMQGSLLLGGACWLALHNDLVGGPGMMIVASILGGRALQPMAQLVAQWRGIVHARDAYKRLNTLFGAPVSDEPGMPLPPPRGVLTVEHLVAGAPGSPTPILRGINFSARPGEVVAVIGASASGKTSLARLLTGIWPAQAGKVRLDGVDVHSWDKSELGPHIGYVPQTVELFDGTVAENIARFGPVDADQVRAAAEQVGLMPMIEALPQGFDTRIGDDGAVLSGGQRQRLALARAVYGNPRFLVLDEPNASLDEEGERALLELLKSLKARGATVIAVMHRTTLLPATDKIVVLHEGQLLMFGPRDEVLAAMKKAAEDARAKAVAQAQARNTLAVAATGGRP